MNYFWHMELKPGKGLGEITFGMLPATVEKILGKPDKVFESEDDEDEFVYQYNGLRTMYTFYKHEKDRLGYIRSSNPAITYGGQPVLDQPVKKLLEGPMNGIKDWRIEKYDFFDTYMNEKSWVILNVEYELVTDIEVGVPLDGDEVYVWM